MSAPPDAAMRCRHCGYDLRGIQSRQCPECGAVFIAEDSATYLTKPESGRNALKFSAWGIACIATPLLLAWASLLAQARQPDEAPCIAGILGLTGAVLCFVGTFHGAIIALGRPVWIVHRRAAVAAVFLGAPIVVLFAFLLFALVISTLR